MSVRQMVLAAALAGCGSGAVAPFTVGAGGASVAVQPQPFALALSRDGAVVARTADPAIEIGLLHPFDPTLYPDPLADDGAVAYHRVTDLVEATQDGERWRLKALTDDSALSVMIELAPEADGGFLLTAAPAPADEVVHVRLSLQAGDGEHFFGLGEYFDTFDQRGQRRDVRFALDPTIESGYNEAHIPVPSYVSTTGFGLLLDNREPLAADMASGDPAVHLTVVAQAMAAHLVAAADPVAAEAALQRKVGTPPLWPPWMFAPFQWRDDDPVTCTVPCDQGCNPSQTGQDLVLADAQAMRAHKLPGSVVWIDAPWMTAFDDFNFNPVQFPDAKGMVAQLHALGYHLMVWSAPFVNSADDRGVECGMVGPPAGGLYDEMAAKGYFVTGKDKQPVMFPWRGSSGAMTDFTNPEAFAFWKSLVKRTTDLGVVGYKMDWDEYIVAAVGSSRPGFVFHDGSTAATEHALMHELWHKAHQEALVEAGGPGFELVRSGDAADAKYAPAVWPGDLDNDFSTHRSPGPDGTALVGGLPSAVNAAVSLAASLHPHYGSDIGGLRHGLPKKEVMARWSEFGALSTVMELGGGGVSHNVWDFTISDFDQELLDIYATYARLHLSLFPYLYAYVKRNSDDGTPILRAPGMMYPDDAALLAASYEYFFGEDLLVAPVVVDGARARDVTFPTGRWVSWWTGEIVNGPTTAKIDAPLDRLPLYARAGAIVPLLAPDVDTLAPASDPGVVTAEMRADRLGIRWFPSGDRVFPMQDGTVLTGHGGSLAIASSPRRRTYTVDAAWHLLATEPPTQVTRASGAPLLLYAQQADYDAAAEGAFWDAAAGLLRLKFTATDETVTIQ